MRGFGDQYKGEYKMPSNHQALISSSYSFDLFTLSPSLLQVRFISSTASGSKIRPTELPTSELMHSADRASWTLDLATPCILHLFCFLGIFIFGGLN